MQVSERIGGVILLHEMKPTELLGSMACLLTGPRKGWILVSVYITSSEWSFTANTDSHQIDMSRDVALRLSSLLQVLVAQSRIAIGDVELVGESADEGLSVTVDRYRVICTWPVPSAWLVLEPFDDEQVNIRLHPVFADEIATSIVRGLADFAPR